LILNHIFTITIKDGLRGIEG